MEGRLAGFGQWLLYDLGYVIVPESLLTGAVLVAALFFPNLHARWFAGLARVLQPITHDAKRQLIIVGLLAILLRAVFLPFVPPPQPVVHDEQSLLLMGQTFVAGRMTNPPHPLWLHFESFHINQQPTYSSVYFPGRGLPTAVGFLFGHPWIGVWISVVFMCVAICWMLQAWVSLPWAFVGGVLAVLRFGVFSYWINSYWGGAITAAGGALVLGALPRVVRSARLRDGCWLGCGILLLMTTRPYEGLLLCAPVAIVLVVWIFHRPGIGAVMRVAAPASVFVIIGALAILYHSWRVTGHPLWTPYDANREQYALAPAFLFNPPYPAKQYRTNRMRQFYEWEFGSYARKYSIKGKLAILLARVGQIWSFYIGPMLTIPFVAALLALSDSRVRFLALTLLLFFAGYVVETWGFAHYASPITSLVLALVVIGLQRLHQMRWRDGLPGRFLSTAIPCASCLVLLVPASTALFGRPQFGAAQGKHWCCTLTDPAPRATVQKQLEGLPGRDLVLVRYSDDYSVHYEWVYNDANIDESAIVWSHDLGPEKNRALIDYFKGRKVWVLELSPGVRPRLLDYQPNFAR